MIPYVRNHDPVRTQYIPYVRYAIMISYVQDIHTIICFSYIPSGSSYNTVKHIWSAGNHPRPCVMSINVFLCFSRSFDLQFRNLRRPPVLFYFKESWINTLYYMCDLSLSCYCAPIFFYSFRQFNQYLTHKSKMAAGSFILSKIILLINQNKI